MIGLGLAIPTVAVNQRLGAGDNPNQRYEDFSTTTIGNIPANTELKRSSVSGDYSVQSADSTKVLRYLATSGSGARGLSYTDMASSGVVQVRALARNVNDNLAEIRLVTFASDSPDSEYGARLNHAGNELDIYKRVSGSFTQLASVAFTLNGTNYYNLLLEVEPGSPNGIRAKAWVEGDSEPGTWGVDQTDSSLDLSGGGWIGSASFDNNNEIRYKSVAIGINGEAAPTS